MNTWVKCTQITFTILLCLSTDHSNAKTQQLSKITPGFEATQKQFINQNGMFLMSKNSIFSFGFYLSVDAPLFVLVINHVFSSTNTWTANRGLLVDNSAKFIFSNDGNACLTSISNAVIWSTNTSKQGVQFMELKDDGNLILIGKNHKLIWQSFDYPTDTLLLGQRFFREMKLTSFPNDLFYYLRLVSGDLVLYGGYDPPQVYWSMSNDTRKYIRKSGTEVS
ncbi:hypothetical protein RND81_09G124100 [Saponaria officinalis]|uniref:Bulb-type lectin domain-containing protein n=1 Tax=Saponaria officinalis TaxID=3572 RepID=A0AAW1IJY0_SAPOF